MKLTYFRGPVPNFGDELNEYIWPRILKPGFLDDNSDTLFIGIGSILYDHYPKDARKLVVGAGYGGYTAPPRVSDGSWDIAFVRGPRTARRLGLPSEKAITDGAILLRTLDLPEPANGLGIAFMPHFDSLGRGHWREACRLAGLFMIDPTDPVALVISQLRGAKAVIVEAMHGAIVADALRVPWIPVRPIHRSHQAKWLDWAESLSLDYRPSTLRPSSLAELYSSLTGRAGQGSLTRLLSGEADNPINRILTHRAAHQLRRLADVEPRLSSDERIGLATSRAVEAVTDLQARYS